MPKLGLVLFTFGNVSEADRICEPQLSQAEWHMTIFPQKMVIVDFDGNTVEGTLNHRLIPKHMVLYKHWEHIGGIVHTHSTCATAWAQSQRDIPIFEPHMQITILLIFLAHHL